MKPTIIDDYADEVKKEIYQIMKECGGTGANIEAVEIENYMPALLLERIDTITNKFNKKLKGSGEE